MDAIDILFSNTVFAYIVCTSGNGGLQAMPLKLKLVRVVLKNVYRKLTKHRDF